MASYEQTMLKLEKMAQANTSTQMNWQERMSNTSHQREVKDLVAAGLNPVLSSGGSGAQSYTTSVDSAVNGIASMASARESASATRYAAQQSAAATRYAAQMNLAAARYAADQSFRSTQYTVDNKPQAAMLQAIKSVGKAIDSDGSIGRRLTNVAKQFGSLLDGNKSAFLVKNGNPSSVKNYSDLSQYGQVKIDDYIKRMGLSNNPSMRQYMINWLFKGDKTAARILYGFAARNPMYAARSLSSYLRK